MLTGFLIGVLACSAALIANRARKRVKAKKMEHREFHTMIE